MKKIIEFLEQPYTTTIVSVVGLTGGFLLGMAINNLVKLQNSFLDKREACKDAYSVMCLQVRTCTGAEVSQCDEIVEKQEFCNGNLPDIQVIFNCEQDLRYIHCDENLPESCSMFME